MLRALIDTIPDSMYVKDTESRYLIANRALAQSFHLASPDELIGRSDFDFLPPELAVLAYQKEQHVLFSGEPVFNQEGTAIGRDGSTIPVISTRVPMRDAQGQVTGVAGVSHNITNRKRNEDALRQAERKYRDIFNEAIIGIFQMAPDGTLLSVNPALAAMLGYASPFAALAATSSGWDALVAPEDTPKAIAQLEKTGRAQHLQREIVREDGSRICIASNVHSILDNGVVLRYDGMTHDITESKVLRSQLLQAQKLESVGQLAAGIAHEINTPVQYVGDNVSFLKSAFADLVELLALTQDLAMREGDSENVAGGADERLKTLAALAARLDLPFLLEEIPRAFTQTQEGIQRVAALVSAMKEFSHPGTGEKSFVDLNRAIQSTVTVAGSEWKYVADLTLDLDPSLPPVCCLAGEFNQVILNLIVNAAHAIGDRVGTGGHDAGVPGSQQTMAKGKISILTRSTPQWAEVHIADTGGGIPEAVQSRIFDPFFTTKEVGRGTGQGLAIARSVIVDKHSGTIHFETTPGQGTTFIIRLPHHAKTAPAGALSASELAKDKLVQERAESQR